MSIDWILKLAAKLKDDLPLAWPHIMTIVMEVKALIAIVDKRMAHGESGPRAAAAATQEAPPLGAGAKKLIDHLDKAGIRPEQSRQAAETLATLDDRLS